tara:strand:+ start:786 stop:983 length:198 start_codon:yes stop_codon:yes gene_type:complete
MISQVGFEVNENDECIPVRFLWLAKGLAGAPSGERMGYHPYMQRQIHQFALILKADKGRTFDRCA